MALSRRIFILFTFTIVAACDYGNSASFIESNPRGKSMIDFCQGNTALASVNDWSEFSSKLNGAESLSFENDYALLLGDASVITNVALPNADMTQVSSAWLYASSKEDVCHETNRKYVTLYFNGERKFVALIVNGVDGIKSHGEENLVKLDRFVIY